MNLIKHIYWRRISQREIRNSAAAEARAGREFISPTPPFLPAPPERSVLVSAALRAAIIQDFAQKRFALRSVIATNLNIANFAGSLLARSPRLRRGGVYPATAGLAFFRIFRQKIKRLLKIKNQFSVQQAAVRRAKHTTK